MRLIVDAATIINETNRQGHRNIQKQWKFTTECYVSFINLISLIYKYNSLAVRFRE